MQSVRMKTLAVLAILLSVAVQAQAWLVLGQHDWDTKPVPNNWTNEYQWTSLTVPSSGGDTGRFLQVTFPATAAPQDQQDQWYDIVHTPASSIFSGSWDTNMWIEFDFWSSNGPPAQLQVQFAATNEVGVTNIWGYVINPLATTNWTTYRASLWNWQDWDFPGITNEQQYLDALAGIDWIGIFIYRSGSGQEIYGIDDFKLMIPEPAEMVLLGFAAVASIAAIRRRRRKGR